jgi:hypothetical protein
VFAMPCQYCPRRVMVPEKNPRISYVIWTGTHVDFLALTGVLICPACGAPLVKEPILYVNMFQILRTNRKKREKKSFETCGWSLDMSMYTVLTLVFWLREWRCLQRAHVRESL